MALDASMWSRKARPYPPNHRKSRPCWARHASLAERHAVSPSAILNLRQIAKPLADSANHSESQKAMSEMAGLVFPVLKSACAKKFIPAQRWTGISPRGTGNGRVGEPAARVLRREECVGVRHHGGRSQDAVVGLVGRSQRRETRLQQARRFPKDSQTFHRFGDPASPGKGAQKRPSGSKLNGHHPRLNRLIGDTR
jgi:hypothetical protein